MRSASPIVSVLLSITLFPSFAVQTEKVYENAFMGFKVTYPDRYEIREYKFNGNQFSAQLKGEKGTIDIRVGAAGLDSDEMPFDEYVKIAAIDQIQNYEELASIAPFISESGIKGYKTYWKVLQTVPPEDFDEPGNLNKAADSYPTLISGPIFVFPPKEKKYDGSQPLKTIMLSYGASPDDKTTKIMIEDLEKIAKSFRY